MKSREQIISDVLLVFDILGELLMKDSEKLRPLMCRTCGHVSKNAITTRGLYEDCDCDALHKCDPIELNPELNLPLQWTSEKPTKVGMYIFFDGHNYLTDPVVQGRWEDTQNPEWLYFRSEPLHQFISQKDNNLWFGPLPDPKRKTVS